MTKVVNLNADKLDGLTANQFGRVVYTENNNTTWTEHGRTTLLSVTLVAPQKGFVTLAGGVDAQYSNGCEYCAVHLRFRIDSATDTTGTIITQAGEQFAPLSRTVTVPVNAGTHTYALVGSWFDLNNTNIAPANWFDPTLSAQFIPFNGTGTTSAAGADQEAASRVVPCSGWPVSLFGARTRGLFPWPSSSRCCRNRFE